jgi:hypothetical protein
MKAASLIGTGLLFAGIASAQGQTPTLQIPQPIEIEHREIHEALDAATKAGGKTGEAASRVMSALQPHFEKEGKFALPQLGALDMLSAKDARISAEFQKDLAERSDRFRAELPKMLDEHKQITSALHEMQVAANAERKPEIAKLAEQIVAHASMEERVLYPASLLIGEFARSKRQ